MAGAKSSQSQNVSSLDQTRQLLDELDSLMERMLALPVNDLESQPPHAGRPGGTISATMTLLDPTPINPQSVSETDASIQANFGLEGAAAAPPSHSETFETYSTPIDFAASVTEPPDASVSSAQAPRAEGSNYAARAPISAVVQPVEADVEPTLDLLPDMLMPASILRMDT